jgi:hypothetical protein
LLEAERFAGRFGLVAGARDHFVEQPQALSSI